MSNGFITLHRKLTQWEWYTAPNHMFLFSHLLLIANYKDGSWRGINYRRGDVLTSLEHLAKETGLSVRNVRTILKNLEKTGEIKRKPTRKLTHLSVCKYDTYQSNGIQGDMQADMKVTLKRHESDNKQQVNNNKQLNKNTSLSEQSSDVADWLEDAEEKYLVLCEMFYNNLILLKAVKKNTNWKTKTWYNAFRLLLTTDGVDYEKEFKPVMNFYFKNYGKEFCPIAESPVSIRTKWNKLKKYYERGNTQPQGSFRP